MSDLHKPSALLHPPEQEIVYREPADVFEYWYNRFRAESPDQRPPLKWLHAKSRLPFSTCHWYRQRMEAAFPDAYAVARAGKNLRLAKKRFKRPQKDHAQKDHAQNDPGIPTLD